MASKVSKHKFQWDLENVFLCTKIFPLSVFYLDVKCFAAISLDANNDVGFSYELSWTDCENKPLSYSCDVQIHDEEGLLWSDKKTTPEGISLNSSVTFPKGKICEEMIARSGIFKIEFNFEFSLQDGVDYGPSCHCTSMAKVALPLFSENVLSDVVVECGEKTFDCHKVILAGRSNVLKTMLTGQFKEAGENKIVIGDCDPEVAKRFVEFIYSDEVAEDAVSWKLYNLAKMYELPKLQSVCLDGLRKSLNVDNCSEMLEATCKHDLEDFFIEAMEFFNENKAEVATTEGWKAVTHNPAALTKIALYPFK